MPPEYTPKFIHHFWSRVDRAGGNSACWPFIGCLVNGYGQLSHNGQLLYAHRVALELSGVSLESGLWALHKCDNPKCCNPNHLYAGTCKDNVNDRCERGPKWIAHAPERYHRGKGDHHLAKFDDDEIRAMRTAHENGISGVKLAEMYGAAQSTIYFILNYRTYKHVS